MFYVFYIKAAAASDGYASNLRVLYSASKHIGSARKPSRHIPQVDCVQVLISPYVLQFFKLNTLRIYYLVLKLFLENNNNNVYCQVLFIHTIYNVRKVMHIFSIL